MGVFYGGIYEELLMRWGLVSLLVWLPWRVLRRGEGAVGAGTMWTAIVLAALLFGAGHLSRMAVTVSLTPMIVLHTIGLNALGGAIFGWLYWRRSLEAAMLAHGGSHLTGYVLYWAVLHHLA